MSHSRARNCGTRIEQRAATVRMRSLMVAVRWSILLKLLSALLLGDGWLRRLSARVGNGVRNRLSGEAIRDSGCTFRAFRRECLRDLVLYHGLHRFIPTLLELDGYRVIEVPVSHRPRRFGRSKYGVWNRALVAFADLLAVCWMKSRRLRYDVAEDLGGDLVRE